MWYITVITALFNAYCHCACAVHLLSRWPPSVRDTVSCGCLAPAGSPLSIWHGGRPCQSPTTAGSCDTCSCRLLADLRCESQLVCGTAHQPHWKPTTSHKVTRRVLFNEAVLLGAVRALECTSAVPGARGHQLTSNGKTYKHTIRQVLAFSLYLCRSTSSALAARNGTYHAAIPFLTRSACAIAQSSRRH